MSGFDDCLREMRGEVCLNTAQLRGQQFVYTLHTSLDPLTTVEITIYGKLTPTEWVSAQVRRGVFQEGTVDVFIFSYREFIVNGVEYRPTNRDRFWYAGQTIDEAYKVRDVVEPERTVAKYALGVHRDRDIYQRG